MDRFRKTAAFDEEVARFCHLHGAAVSSSAHFRNTNTGHTFPDTLDADEKIAVIEYLKIL